VGSLRGWKSAFTLVRSAKQVFECLGGNDSWIGADD